MTTERQSGNAQPHRPLGIYVTLIAALLRAPILTPIWSTLKWVVKRKLRRTIKVGDDEKLHPGVAEGYQLLALAALGSGVAMMPVTAGPYFVWRVFAGYRAWEILVYGLRWFFVDPEVLHSYRRSVLAFLLNIVELSAAFTLLGLSQSVSHSQRWNETLWNVGRVLRLERPDSIRAPFDTLFAIEAWVLVVFVLACAIGGISRKAEEQPTGAV